MKIEGLKVLADKGWKQASQFVTPEGRTIGIPANHKLVCIDENGDVANVSIVTDVPMSVKPQQAISVKLAGAVSRNSFGWTFKATL